MGLLATLRRDHPAILSELRRIARKPPPARSTTNTVPGGTAQSPLTRADRIASVPVGDQVAGDHLDFRNSTFHDRVVGVQHNHYGPVSAPAEWRPVGEVGAVEFGVRPTRHVPGLPDVPPYVTRDCDEDLRAKLAHHGLVLILGERYAGKSYTAWHAVRSLADHRLYAPDPGEDLRDLVAALKGRPGKYVVWLDELTDHLGEGALEPRLLGRLTSHGAVVLGTMSPDEYYRRRAGIAPGDRVVAMARTVELPREWSEAELARLAAHDDDPRAYPAYMWSGKEGAASYFAIGHLLFDEWRRAGTRREHPRGRSLVRAAVDLARCGVMGAVRVDLLREVQEQYGTEERESFEDALAWATAPKFGASGLLVQGDEGGTWRAYGALVAEALRSDDLEPVPDAVWWMLLDATEGDALNQDAVVNAARTALRPRIERGEAEVMFRLGIYIGGDDGEALARRAADVGHQQAVEYMARRLLNRGAEGDALPYLEAAASSGISWAGLELGRIHGDRAEHWLREAAKAGDVEAARLLGELLMGKAGHENQTGAMHWCLTAYEAGDISAAVLLGRQRQGDGDAESAEMWYRRASDAGDMQGMHYLGVLLQLRGGESAKEGTELRRRAAGDDKPRPGPTTAG
ncbi:tetratricopeptide repeat protein [Streptomyces fulvoviolaceus]|uniref:tetratricopeptide repeat protein n=1 Tax=Streptomyces fulvoviolaceus TaxID=285535 RepID=UPI0004CC78B5|nr:tetratricopeptide repeat protein [Streptomyces fulvoviolaceus]